MTASALLRITHGWLMITPFARISFPGAEFALVKTVAALNGAFAPFRYTGVLFLDAVSAASKFWELSCKAVWPLMVLPAALATTMLVVPPPEPMVVTSALLTALPALVGTYLAKLLPALMTPPPPSYPH